MAGWGAAGGLSGTALCVPWPCRGRRVSDGTHRSGETAGRLLQPITVNPEQRTVLWGAVGERSGRGDVMLPWLTQSSRLVSSGATSCGTHSKPWTYIIMYI